MTSPNDRVEYAIDQLRAWLALPDATDRDAEMAAWVLHLVTGRASEDILSVIRPVAPLEQAPRFAVAPSTVVPVVPDIQDPAGFEALSTVDGLMAGFNVVGEAAAAVEADLSLDPAESRGRAVTVDPVSGAVVLLDHPHSEGDEPPRPV